MLFKFQKILVDYYYSDNKLLKENQKRPQLFVHYVGPFRKRMVLIKRL